MKKSIFIAVTTALLSLTALMPLGFCKCVSSYDPPVDTLTPPPPKFPSLDGTPSGLFKKKKIASLTVHKNPPLSAETVFLDFSVVSVSQSSLLIMEIAAFGLQHHFYDEIHVEFVSQKNNTDSLNSCIFYFQNYDYGLFRSVNENNYNLYFHFVFPDFYVSMIKNFRINKISFVYQKNVKEFKIPAAQSLVASEKVNQYYSTFLNN